MLSAAARRARSRPGSSSARPRACRGGCRSARCSGGAEPIVDLAVPVDPERDHMRGPGDAPVTLVEYGDFECPYCGQAEPVVRELLADFGDVRYVWRHLPLTDVHPQRPARRRGGRGGGRAGRVLGDARPAARPPGRAPSHATCVATRASSGSTSSASRTTCGRRHVRRRIAEDVDSADLSGVSGTPTFFVNGRRHHGAYDIATLSAAVRAARGRAALAPVG